ncbi:MAG: prephenate dehydrogenase, partial [Cloacibacillus sp.]|nr:prephenate dehydrogenase [Cloacibacillus sp.]
VQSRRPGREWQDALRRGWRVFWQRELKERREWELPPFMPMIKITTPAGVAEKITPQLEESEIEYWISEENNEEIWVRTKRFQQLKNILQPFFDIRATRNGFPTVLLYLD